MVNGKRKLVIASDHAGYGLKTILISFFEGKYEIEDLGCDSADISVDYPDFAQKVALKIENNQEIIGILVCGSGIGVSIAANRSKNVRAALCMNSKMAELSRLHNNSNVLCLGARLIDENEAKDIVKAFLATEFEGGRHESRVKKMS